MMHKAVASFILHDEDGRVLLQQRDDKPGLAYAGYWTLFGGQVEAGETPEEAVHRELYEELGVDLQLVCWMTYVCPVRSKPGELTLTNHVYVGRLTLPLSSLTLREGQAMRLFSQHESADLPLAFDQHIPLRTYFAAQGSMQGEGQ